MCLNPKSDQAPEEALNPYNPGSQAGLNQESREIPTLSRDENPCFLANFTPKLANFGGVWGGHRMGVRPQRMEWSFGHSIRMECGSFARHSYPVPPSKYHIFNIDYIRKK